MSVILHINEDYLEAEFLMGDDLVIDEFRNAIELNFTEDEFGAMKLTKVYSKFLNVDTHNPLHTYIDKVEIKAFDSVLDTLMVKAVQDHYKGDVPEVVTVQLTKVTPKLNEGVTHES